MELAQNKNVLKKGQKICSIILWIVPQNYGACMWCEKTLNYSIWMSLRCLNFIMLLSPLVLTCHHISVSVNLIILYG